METEVSSLSWFPDYKNGISISSNYTAISNGWVQVQIAGSSSTSSGDDMSGGYLLIDGINVLMSYYGWSYTSGGNLLIAPVQKNSVITTKVSQNGSVNSLKFFPTIY